MTGYEKPELFAAGMARAQSFSVLDNGELIPMKYTVIIPFQTTKEQKGYTCVEQTQHLV